MTFESSFFLFGQEVHLHTNEENGHVRFLKEINKLSDFEKFEREKLQRIEEEKKEKMKDVSKNKILYPWLFGYEKVTKKIGKKQKKKHYQYLQFIKKGFYDQDFICPEWSLPEEIKEGEEKVSLRPFESCRIFVKFFIFSGIRNGKKFSSSITIISYHQH